jgi:hypothetical protein
MPDDFSGNINATLFGSSNGGILSALATLKHPGYNFRFTYANVPNGEYDIIASRTIEFDPSHPTIRSYGPAQRATFVASFSIVSVIMDDARSTSETLESKCTLTSFEYDNPDLTSNSFNNDAHRSV